jgi:hypothetical protein
MADVIPTRTDAKFSAFSLSAAIEKSKHPVSTCRPVHHAEFIGQTFLAETGTQVAHNGAEISTNWEFEGTTRI